ncbi:Stage II sporulation protein Q [Fundidesulfovibrio magnetotacticus]|uniref:Stage II sporulation protein Q n=1 Tax=Fundidesulfovibrio magnetotacticus TaxID=2730080 RepID=A0A6V8LR85_9BACT|nr:M23 family metallopeptidase [Fundidesulfovibrio magnetotacticus]GFK92276.1 Stage II sporulation protein Q [Fundidesulfovibrio magnetotacticus]
MGKLISLLLLIVLVGLGVGAYLFTRDMAAPEVSLTPERAATGAKREFTLQARDQASGIKTVKVSVLQAQKETTVLQKTFDPAPAEVREAFTLEQAGLREGQFDIIVVVTDKSVFNFGAGNTTRVTRTMALDNRAPVISVLSQAHHIKQGGACGVVYQVNKDVERSGVFVGDRFYPGYKLPSGNYACIFGFPWNMDIKAFQPRLYAEDQAGNERAISFRFNAKPTKFKHDSINIGDDFLQSKMPQFEAIYPDIKDPIQLYVKVNRDLRKENVAKLGEFARNSAPQMLWEGVFLRLPNAAPRAGFGDGRTYLYKNQKIDEETHLGVDLASLENAQVPAANSGRVIYTGFFGIYGNAVIIDHGWGLQSIYSHLSQITAKEGDTVRKGDIIGNTGATGLAAGDHLHFGLILGGIEIQPIEWWDPHWIKDNITDKFQ